jgi:hypothetical protein
LARPQIVSCSRLLSATRFHSDDPLPERVISEFSKKSACLMTLAGAKDQAPPSFGGA